MAGKAAAKSGTKAGDDGDGMERILRKLEAISRAAILIKATDRLPPGPQHDRMVARVDRMVAALRRMPW
jgi:hypothetical protein